MAQRTKPPLSRGDFPGCFDAYLRFAIATDFRDFEFFDDENFKLFLLVELKEAKLLGPFQSAIGEFGAQFGPDVGETRYATMRCPKRAVVDAETVKIWNDNVSRVELSLPLKPSQPEPSIRPRRPCKKMSWRHLAVQRDGILAVASRCTPHHQRCSRMCP